MPLKRSASPEADRSNIHDDPTISFNHRDLLLFLDNAIASANNGPGKPKSNPNTSHNAKGILLTIPWTILLFQIVWSAVVTGIAFSLGDDTFSTLSNGFWQTRLSVSPSITYGVGWALFVLLGFFITESSKRFFEAQKSIGNIGAQLQRVVRCLRQGYPKGSFHQGDYDRIIAHLIALPIALKMMLRSERDASQLKHVLHSDDVADTIRSSGMHTHCSRVIRSYFSAAEDDSPESFKLMNCEKTPAGFGIRYFVIDMLDNIDASATSNMRILQSGPSAGYVNHLHIFLYIWMMFLPLSLVSSSGWFTVLFSVLITYGVCMLFTIAKALNDPFGFDVHDINLNSLCCSISRDLLLEFIHGKFEPTDVIIPDHDTPTWMEESPSKLEYTFHQPSSNVPTSNSSKSPRFSFIKKVFRPRPLRPEISIALAAFVLWSAFIIFLTWRLSRNNVREPPGVRWWFVYIPINTDTTGFVSLGLFLLLGFWLNDAYGRYWRGLQLWQSNIRPNIENVAFCLAVANNNGTWHSRDRERIFSHFAALPYAAKLVLRGDNDLEELSKILSKEDVQILLAAPNALSHVFNVIYGYINSSDNPEQCPDNICTLKESPYLTSRYGMLYSLWSAEKSFDECFFIKAFPISPAFTIHLRLFTAFWLALLPTTTVIHDGFLSFVYLLPIAYSIINLLIIGDELTDPFGNDEHDIPLNIFCKEILDSLHRIYHATSNDKALVHASDYDRGDFIARRRKVTTEEIKEEDEIGVEGINQSKVFESVKPAVTVKQIIAKVINVLPTVSWIAQIAITVWTIIVVFVSYELSKIWDGDRNESQLNGWSSPIDIDTSVLGNSGFALFLILAFRALDGISRYDEGAQIIFDLEMNLRNLAIQIVQSMEDNCYHKNDKERLIAHLTQIPLCFRDLLLDIKRDSAEEKEGLLSDEDRADFEKSPAPLEHLINTVQAYVVLQDVSTKVDYMDKEFNISRPVSEMLIARLTNIRKIIARAIGVKRFPVVGSYISHQRLFAGIWLAFLPLSMTNQTGWFTILWTPIVAYGVFGMEEIAAKLVDPLGNDSIDIPVDKLCTNTANSILVAVNSVRWGNDYHTQPSPNEMQLGLGIMLKGHIVEDRHTLNHLNDSTISVDVSKGEKLLISGPNQRKLKPSIMSHLLHSVPWSWIMIVTTWTILACVISYVSRKREFDGNNRWWVSLISVSESVALFVSIAAFSLLGFYVVAALGRYYSAGGIWVEKLRTSCHFIVRSFLSLSPPGSIHEGDHERILGHVAAIPLVLKAQLSGSSDLREIRGFLSHDDLGRIQCADSMTSHCVDVLRSYMYKVMCNGNIVSSSSEWPKPESCSIFLRDHIIQLEECIKLAIFLNEFPISEGFIGLLNMLLFIWFLILPFVLAELSGWFTILWMIIISYGVLGMYSIATEIQNPFGTDLNDLDLYEIAMKIVADVVNVASEQKNGWKSLITARPVPDFWKLGNQASSVQPQDQEQDQDQDQEQEQEQEKDSVKNKTKEKKIIGNSPWIQNLKVGMRLAAMAVPLWVMGAVLVWSTVAVTLSWVVARFWPLHDTLDGACAPWFCSKIAISSSTQSYIGFAFFLLLGNRLVDSHRRYTDAIEIWQVRLPGAIRVGCERILGTFHSNTFHENDIERILGHFAAYPICLMGSLRGIDYKEKLLQVLSEDDVNDILTSHESVDYCRDVLWSYMSDTERIMQYDVSKCPIGFHEHKSICYFLKSIEASTIECQQIIKIPLPFGYTQHLRIFLSIYLLLLPFGLVESSGWITILWTFFISYGVIAIERWAEELSDPFGFDISDVPLETLTDGIVNAVKSNYELFQNGLGTFIVTNRQFTESEPSTLSG